MGSEQFDELLNSATGPSRMCIIVSRVFWFKLKSRGMQLPVIVSDTDGITFNFKQVIVFIANDLSLTALVFKDGKALWCREFDTTNDLIDAMEI